jgi:acyl-CoA hydrolase
VKPGRQRHVTLRFLAEPTHVNFGGKVHGGQLMKWIDQAGYTCAVAWSGVYCVTSYVGAIRFLAPIRVGDLVELRSLVIHTGRTSIHIAIDVYAGDPKASERRRVGHCVIVFVGVDADGRPTPVPAWAPETETDRALQTYALRLSELRNVMDTEMEAHLAVLERGEAEARG